MTEPTEPKPAPWDFAALDAAGAALAGRVGRSADDESDLEAAGAPPGSSLSIDTDNSGAAAAGSAGSAGAEPADDEAAEPDFVMPDAEAREDAEDDAEDAQPAKTDADPVKADLEAAGAPPGSSLSIDTDNSGPAGAEQDEHDGVAEADFVMPDAEAREDVETEPPAEEADLEPAGGPPDSSLSPDSDNSGPDAQLTPESETVDSDAVDSAAVTAALEAAELANASLEDIEDSGLPDLEDDQEFEGALESVLLVVDSPIAEDQLSSALEQPVKRVKEALRRISARYTESGSGIDLRRVGDGWRFYTRDRFAPFVEKLLLDGQRAKLTRAALETLAVIAYRQPVTRARIAAVRGVNVDGVIRTLVARGLIEETGTDGETGGILYRTTELFLERLGLPSLADLPPIAPLLPEVDAIDDV